ncbi:MAG: TonB-dependent receptor [Ignavibacteriae bacterium]|nr:TonB-dependent receptor [Ignavibacteriota bacterium]MCB9242305.1 TonB-dependent receptor [Ignavibacteriales bacterium]
MRHPKILSKGFLSVIIVIISYLFVNSSSYAQTTGSIGGTVIDANDNTPLEGAIVRIVGTNKATQTNENGEYRIINVDVGTYSVQADYIGYDSIIVQNIKVSVDKVANVDFRMGEVGGLVIEGGDIIAQRSALDVTQTGSIVTGEQIENRGTRGIQNIAAQTSGVVTDERGQNINVRGLRSNENQVIIDGVSTTNPVNGNSTGYVPNSLLQEIAVLTGGFGAEYGNALGGQINVTTRSGSSSYSGSIEAITDEFNGSWDNTTAQGYNLYNVSFGGPLIPSKNLASVINFYTSVERQYLKVRGPSWIADQLFEDGIIPNYSQQIWNYSGRLTFDLLSLKNGPPITLKMGALVTDNHQRNFVQSYLKKNSSRNPLQLIRDNQYYARISHQISDNFFYELQGNYYNSIDETGDAWFLSDWFAYGDTLSNPGLTVQGNVLGDDESTGNVFRKYGRVFNQYDKKELNYLGGKLDASLNLLTKKTGKHELKFGGEYRYHTLKKVFLNPAGVANNPIDPNTGQLAVKPEDLWFGRNVLLNSYGYDIRDQYGNQIVSDEDINSKHPIIGAAYLRDKIDFGDFLVNVGLRMDYLDVNTDVIKDPYDLIGADGQLLSSDDYEQSSADINISPRLGFSFPITDKTVFIANYGKFVQMPPLDFLYINKLAFQKFFSNSVQNVVENSSLQPEKLTSYEVGFKQQVGDIVNFGATVYYRETTDQIGITRIAGSATVPSGYALYYNSDFSISRGIDFYLSMRRTNRLSVDIAYTLLYASGVGSDPNTKFALANNQTGELPVFEFPLDYDQRHTGIINADYRFGSDDVPKGFWGGVLSNLGLNTLFSFNSGRPYTSRDLPKGAFLDDGNAVSTKNEVYTGWNLRLDMRLDKTVNIWKTSWNFYIYALNVLNSELVNSVYGATGSPYDNGYLQTPTGSIQSEVYKENFYERIKTVTNWGTPRQIRFGLKVSF